MALIGQARFLASRIHSAAWFTSKLIVEIAPKKSDCEACHYLNSAIAAKF